MTDKIVYLYDKTSHKLIGTEFLYENAAKPGEYLIPENGTLLMLGVLLKIKTNRFPKKKLKKPS